MRTGSYNIANLTLTAEKFLAGFEVSASIYNIFGQHYALPAGDETLIDKIPQDGRNFRLWFTYHFQ
jgi:iron complex outermembrane receptor protein